MAHTNRIAKKKLDKRVSLMCVVLLNTDEIAVEKHLPFIADFLSRL